MRHRSPLQAERRDMPLYADIERGDIVGGGTRLQARDRDGFVLGTAVTFPGHLWRIYHVGGRMTDHVTESDAIRALNHLIEQAH
jgi:hypothetical protein